MTSWFSIYGRFARQNVQFLGFGFLLCFTSSAGQTYFVGIFGADIRTEFGLSYTEWGTIYLIGTLASAILLPWSGQLLDRVDLRYFIIACMSGLALACWSISRVDSIVLLTITIFLLRQFGQGLTSLSGTTSMARYYSKNRGKAIAIASMGYSLGEAVLPISAVLLIGLLGWRETYQLAALGVVLLIPLALFTLQGQRQRHEHYLHTLNQPTHAMQTNQPQNDANYTRRRVLSEWRFYLMTPALLMPPMISTALFFHHLTMADYKHWSAQWVTGSYWIYALASVAAMLISGPLIDRFTAKRIMPLYLLPLILALLVIGAAHASAMIIPYMLLFGINNGVYHTGSTALWAELYGQKYIGSIKSLMVALSVLSTAVGPVIVGIMLDNGLSFNVVCQWLALACVVSTVLLWRALGGFKPMSIRH